MTHPASILIVLLGLSGCVRAAPSSLPHCKDTVYLPDTPREHTVMNCDFTKLIRKAINDDIQKELDSKPKILSKWETHAYDNLIALEGHHENTERKD